MLQRLEGTAGLTPEGRWSRRPQQWLLLLLILRAAATATAVTLLAVHRVTDYDGLLVAAVVVHASATGVAVVRWPRVIGKPTAWAADVVAVFALISVSQDWRSPFYLLALTTLAAPAASLGARRATFLGCAYTLAFAVAAHFIGPDPLHLGTQASKETLAAHLVLPIMTCLGVGYAAETLRNLEGQRSRAERLAIEAERRRIAWELHDSAKQRIHAAHLVISSLAGGPDRAANGLVDQALGELQAAAIEMDTSVAELQEPLLGRPLGEALRERASELSVAGGPKISVAGDLPRLAPLPAAHAYRIAAEALTNAIRHAGAQHIDISLETRDGMAIVTIADDGRGLPATPRPGSTGLLSMQGRAVSIGGNLALTSPPDGGATVELVFPMEAANQTST